MNSEGYFVFDKREAENISENSEEGKDDSYINEPLNNLDSNESDCDDTEEEEEVGCNEALDKIYEENGWKSKINFNSNDMTEWENKYPILNSICQSCDPIEIFNIFFTDDLWNIIVSQTNLYAEQFISDNKDYLKKHKSSRVSRWERVDTDEIRAFIGINLYTTMVKVPDLRDYWSSNPLFHSVITKFMTRDRFEIISKFLHLNNNKESNSKLDRLHKVRPLLDYCQNKFQEICSPGICITVDEDIIGFKGVVGFKQYIKSKPTKWGIKIDKVCCPRSAYCFNFKIYSGKNDSLVTTNKNKMTQQTVIALTEKYLNAGRHIIADNYYISPELAIYLANNKTGLTGTIRANRIKNSSVILNDKQLKKKQLDFKDNNCLRLMQFYDKRAVRLLTTSHCFQQSEFVFNKDTKVVTEMNKHNSDVEKKLILSNYSYYMSGVDKSNQMIKAYKSKQKFQKWWKAVFFYFMNTLILNSYIVHKLKGGSLSHKDFLVKIVEYLLQKKNKPSIKYHRAIHIDPKLKSRKRKNCCMCSEKTSWKCSLCSSNSIQPVILCRYNCFEEYHDKIL